MNKVFITKNDEIQQLVIMGRLISLDIETTNLRYDKAEITGISLCDGVNAYYIVIGKGYCEMGKTLQYIEQVFNKIERLYIIAHNWLFDASILYKYGLDLSNYGVRDTMVLHHLIDETDHHGLKHLVRNILEEEVEDYNPKLSHYTQEFWNYGIADSINTWNLYHKLKPQLTEKQEYLYCVIESNYLKVLLEMKITGITIDLEKSNRILKELEIEEKKLKTMLYDMVGIPYTIQYSILGEPLNVVCGVNLNSSNDLAKILFDTLGLEKVGLTPSGKPKTGKAVISAYAKSVPFVGLLEKYKIVTKLLTAFFKPLPSMIESDNVIRPTLKDTGAKTGRLSCSNPNIQQLPKVNKEFPVDTRACFIAPKGYKMITIDYSGQELRVLAHITQSKNMIEAFNSGRDFHQETADKFGVSRTMAKAINFGIAYRKAQPLTAKILTPFGWSNFGDIKEGDWVFTAKGSPTLVTKVHPIEKQRTYRVTMKDGSSTECGEEHLWTIQTIYDKQIGKERTLMLKDIIPILKKGKQNNCFIQYNAPLFYKSKIQYIHPYIMGLYIGDGDSCNRLSIFNNDIKEKVEYLLPKGLKLNKYREGHYNIVKDNNEGLRNPDGTFVNSNNFINEMRKYGFNNMNSSNKRIPLNYLYGDVAQRKELLKGLIDSDGHRNNNSFCYTTISKGLSEDVKFLVKSLGGRCTITSRIPKTNFGSAQLAYTLFISFPPFRQSNSIESIEYIGEKDCRCITIDSEEGLYITDDFIVTHNSAYGFSKDWGVTEEEAQGYLDKYFEQFPEVKEAMIKNDKILDDYGFVETLFGRRRHFVKEEEGYYKKKCYREAFNFLIQGFAADMIRVASIRVHSRKKAFPEWGLKAIMTVHDEVVYIVKESYIKEATLLIQQEFNRAVKLCVPVESEIGVGDNYGTAK